MKIDLIRTIERIPKDKTGEIEKGEKLSVSFKGMISQVTVLVTPLSDVDEETLTENSRKILPRNSDGGATCCQFPIQLLNIIETCSC